MCSVRRAAVTGLFALWLAPLAAQAPACGPEERCIACRDAAEPATAPALPKAARPAEDAARG